MTLRADDPAAIAPPTDDEIIAAWEGGKAGKGFEDSVPRRFRALVSVSLFDPVEPTLTYDRAERLRPLRAAHDRGAFAKFETEEKQLAALCRGNGRKPK